MLIYKAKNMINGKVYIGLTTRSLEQRKAEHISDSKCSSDAPFHRAIRKYGIDNFTWEIIDSASSREELADKEMYWVSFYNAYINSDSSNGYNSTMGGEGLSGYTFTDSHKKKISDSRIGKEKFRGSNSRVSKLKEEDVLAIKKLLKNGASQTNVAEKFNVDVTTISCIKNGKTWAHVGEDISSIQYSQTRNFKLSENDVVEIKLLIKQGIRFGEIANKFNVHQSRISAINCGREWGHVAI